jgi:hypothetical protein
VVCWVLEKMWRNGKFACEEAVASGCAVVLVVGVVLLSCPGRIAASNEVSFGLAGLVVESSLVRTQVFLAAATTWEFVARRISAPEERCALEKYVPTYVG